MSSAADTSNRASKKNARAVVKFQSREINILVKYYGTELRDLFVFAIHKSYVTSNWKGQTGIQRSMYCYNLIQIYVGKANTTIFVSIRLVSVHARIKKVLSEE